MIDLVIELDVYDPEEIQEINVTLTLSPEAWFDGLDVWIPTGRRGARFGIAQIQMIPTGIQRDQRIQPGKHDLANMCIVLCRVV